ncbi:PucR family transcriptional regulator [Nonomuraea deserti]|uniref:PucR family transcriptional regulator n=1 Tax=Nonomuraea deserti TaxID=1848322 RepID=A0A4R4W0G2_9ACTN|nr:helix-turn-helix domain-containing protein [Nonomuraea deserti]TDD11902.1 PucR family transcriptional regulator [Nonomuraea deserti]
MVAPRARLSRLLDDLGRMLLDLIASPGDLDGELTGVAIHGPGDELTVEPGELVLGVGLHDNDTIAELLRRLGERRAVGLVVKHPVTADASVVAAVRDSGVALLGLNRAASWSHVAAMLRALPLATTDITGGADLLAGAPAGDLFALANAVGALLDAPVTIEDRASRVLAFSGHQHCADQGRVETILGRQVPDRYTQLLEQRGAFRELSKGTPVYIEPLAEDMLPRVAIVVRAGDEVLGSMWAVVGEPLSEVRAAAFADSAKIVALHMLRARAGADVGRRLSADLVAMVLEGGPGAPEAANRLGLTDGRLCVMAAQVVTGDAADTEAAMQRLRDALALHFAAVHPRSAAALLGGTTYVVLPVSTSGDRDGTSSVVRLAVDFLARVGARTDAVIGVGRATMSLAEVTHSRREADRALRVLQTDRRGRRIARYSDVQVESLLLRLADLVAEDGELHLGSLGALVDYDAEHESGFVDTLSAYLDAFGNVGEAAAAMHLHPNSFRYRLRRVCEITGLDLTDADARLAATLQLRLYRVARDRGVVKETGSPRSRW